MYEDTTKIIILYSLVFPAALFFLHIVSRKKNTNIFTIYFKNKLGEVNFTTLLNAQEP